MATKKFQLVYVILLLIIPVFIQAQPADLEQKIDQLFSNFDEEDRPGAAVAVVKDGALLFSKGYGSANLEYDIPVTPTTVFHIASISKQFTVFAILLLEAEGKLSLDDDIRKHIPEVPDFGSEITLQHLASHTSGMRDQWNLLAMAGWRLDDVITKEHVLKLIAQQKELNFEPGDRYTYCNSGFTLLAEVVSRVSGQSFAEFCKERIFEPLEMEHTLFYDDHQKIVKNRAYSYSRNASGYIKQVLSYANVGATSLFTTVEDQAKWAMNFKKQTVGNAKIFKTMRTPAVLNNGDTFGGALGQFVDEYSGHKQIQHGGADAGYRTYMGRFPKENLAVIVFSNYGNANPNRLALNVADLFLEEKTSTESTSSSKQPTKVKGVKLSTKALKQFTGSYWNDADAYSRWIVLQKDTLWYNRGGVNQSPLVPIGENSFQMLNVTVDLVVNFEQAGDQKKMIVKVGTDAPIESVLYEASNFSAKELKQYEGAYHSPELQTTYTLKVKGDQLFMTHTRHPDFPINDIMKDRFQANAWFMGNLKFERNAKGELSGFRASSGRVLNLLFNKIEN